MLGPPKFWLDMAAHSPLAARFASSESGTLSRSASSHTRVTLLIEVVIGLVCCVMPMVRLCPLREPATQLVGDTEVSAAVLLAAGRECGVLDLVEGAGECAGVAGDLGAHRVGEVLALPAHAQGEQPCDQGSEQPAQCPEDEDDDQDRVAPLLPTTAPATA